MVKTVSAAGEEAAPCTSEEEGALSLRAGCQPAQVGWVKAGWEGGEGPAAAGEEELALVGMGLGLLEVEAFCLALVAIFIRRGRV